MSRIYEVRRDNDLFELFRGREYLKVFSEGCDATFYDLFDYVLQNKQECKDGINLNDFLDWFCTSEHTSGTYMEWRKMQSEEDIRQYEQKVEYFHNAPALDNLDLVELTQQEFIETIFERDSKTKKDVVPFEDKRSKEYVLWLTQKKMGKKVIDYKGYACWRYNPIVFVRQGSNCTHKVLLNDAGESFAGLEEMQLVGPDLALLSPVTYVGRNNTADNARYLYAFTFDLDGVGIEQVEGLVKCIDMGIVPAPNMIVNSGHGLHLYFLLSNPTPLFLKNHKLLNKLKRGLTDKIWNDLTSNDPKIQYQGIFQSFRLPGTKNKFGRTIKAYLCKGVRHMYSVEDLNDFVIDSKKLSEKELLELTKAPKYNPTGVVLSEAEKLWPEWYVSRILENKYCSSKWHVKRDVYDWWLKKLRDSKDEVKLSHRYWCILTLVVYGVKCDVPRDEVYIDALSLVDKFDKLTVSESNHFTRGDVDDAMKSYDEKYSTWPIHTIEETTAIRIERNRRNGRKQADHLKRARFSRDLDHENWREGNGRKKGSVILSGSSRCAQIIKNWREKFPGCNNKAKCARDTGLTRPTIHKWWDACNDTEKDKKT